MKIKTLKISITLLSFSVIFGGFFYFKNSNKPLVYESNAVVEESVAESIKADNNEKSAPIDIAEIPPEIDIDEKKIEIPEQTKPAEPNDVRKIEKNSTDSLKIDNNLVNWGFSESKEREINTIVLHSSYNALGGDEYDLDRLIAEYKEYGVAPHYVIDRKGNIYRLVKDNDVAYHAGESKTPDGKTGVNNFSLGIELMNTKDDKYTDSQYQALNSLIDLLKDKYEIKYVLGHNQIAPGRKTDPWNINWEKVDK